MKESWRKDALRNIKKRIISWLSIVTIVVISAGVILGICFPMYTLKQTGDIYFKEHNFKDADIASSIGVKASDVDSIKQNNLIKNAEGLLNLPGVVSKGEKSCNIKVLTMTKDISVPYALEGRLPLKNTECAISFEIANALNASIGDTILIKMTNSRFKDVLKAEKLLITGIAEHPDYFGTNRDGFIVVSYSLFDTKDLAFDYTDILVDADISDDLNTMSYEYLLKAKAVKNELSNDSEILAAARKEDFEKELDDEYEKAVKKVEDELQDAKKKLDDGQKEFDEKIADAKKELSDGEKEYFSGKEKAEKELFDAEKKIRDGENEYNTKIADGEKQLADAKKQLEDELNDAKYKLFQGFLELDNAEKTLNEKEKEYAQGVLQLNSGREELNKGWDEYDNGLFTIESYFSDTNIDTAISFLSLLNESESEYEVSPVIIDNLRVIKGYSTLKKLEAMIDILDAIPGEYKDQLIEEMGLNENGGDLRSKFEELMEAENTLNESEEKIKSGAKELEEGRKLLDQGWFSLAQGKKELSEGQAELERKEPQARQLLKDKEKEFEEKKNEGAKELADAKKTFAKKKAEALNELEKARKELEDGKEEFEREKKKGEDELKKAKKEYEDGKKEAYEKLADAKKEIDDAKKSDGKWLVQMRDANLNYIELKSNVDVLNNFTFVFMPIFGGITVIVCFFTIAIIVEEQKKQIGVVKAFGAFKDEIRAKYIIFGVSAAIFGVVIGVFGGLLLEALILNTMKGMFVFEDLVHKANPVPVIIFFVCAVFLTTIVVIWSCEKYLSCSATGLLSGSEPVNKARKKAAKGDSGSMYIKMIINNFYTDIGRVIISVVIVLACCMLIGLGITLKLTFDTSLNSQIDELWNYNIKVVLKNDISDKDRNVFIKELGDNDYYSVYRLGSVLQTDDKQALTEVYCIKDEKRFSNFWKLVSTDYEKISLPKEGLLVTEEMKQKDGLTIGTKLTMTTDELKMGEVVVKGNFLQYYGKCAFMSKDYFDELFDEKTKENCYFIKTNGNEQALFEKLKEKPYIDLVEKKDTIKEKNKSMLDLFDIVVYLVLAFSLILSFMILLNLSNIQVLRRMRELLTLRVNGFSNGQVIGYLAREVAVTTIIGIILGVAVGIPISILCIRTMETTGFMYVINVYPSAWIVAALSCLLFAFLINSIAFRKIGRVPLTDITKY